MNQKVDSNSILVPKKGSGSISERLGLVNFYDTGIPVYSTLAYIYLKLISDLIIERMGRKGFREFRLPILQNRILWELSGRYQTYNEKLETKNYVLSATAEEYAS